MFYENSFLVCSLKIYTYTHISTIAYTYRCISNHLGETKWPQKSTGRAHVRRPQTGGNHERELMKFPAMAH